MSLLTGEPRSATVRAVDGALVYEVGRRQLQPLLAARPELFDALQERDGRRACETQESFLERYDAARCAKAFTRRFAKSRARRRPRGARGSARRRRARVGQLARAAGAATPYSGGSDDRGGEAGERQVGGGEAVADEVRAAV